MRLFTLILSFFCLVSWIHAGEENDDISPRQYLRIKQKKVEMGGNELFQIDLIPSQIEQLKLSPEQRTGLIYSPVQLETMKLTKEQYEQLGLSDSQKKQLKISDFTTSKDKKEDNGKKEKTGKKESYNLSAQDLSDLDLTKKQIGDLKITSDQFQNMTVEVPQLIKLQLYKQTKLTPEQLSKINPDKKQLESLSLSEPQSRIIELSILKPVIQELNASEMKRLSFTPAQIGKMALGPKQLGKIRLTKIQMNFLKIKSWIRLSSKDKRKLLAKLQKSKFKLNSYQWSLLKIDSKQISRIKFNKRQMTLLRQFLEIKLEKKRYAKMQRYLTADAILKLHLSYEQIKGARLRPEQYLLVKLHEEQIENMALKREDVEKSREAGIKVLNKEVTIDELSGKEKFLFHKVSTLLKGISLTDEQVSQIPFEEDQLAALELNEKQKLIVKDAYNVYRSKLAFLNFLKSDSSKKFAELFLTPDQIDEMHLSTEQIIGLQFEDNQLNKVGLQRSDLEKLRDWRKEVGETFLRRLKSKEKTYGEQLKEMEEIGKRIKWIKLEPEQINLNLLTDNQIDSLELNSKQIFESLYINDLQEKKKVNESYLKFLKDNLNSVSEEDKISYGQMQDLFLSEEQLLEIEFRPYQLQKAGITNEMYALFRNTMIEKMETGMSSKLDKYELDDYINTINGLRKINLEQEQFLNIILSSHQLRKLTLTNYQVYKYLYRREGQDRPGINRLVIGRVQIQKERYEKYLSTTPERKIEVNKALVEFVKNEKLADRSDLNIFSQLQMKDITLSLDDLIKAGLTKEQVKNRGLTEKGFQKLKELHKYFVEDRSLELSQRDIEKYEFFKSKIEDVQLSLSQFFSVDFRKDQLESIQFTQDQVNNIINLMPREYKEKNNLKEVYSYNRAKTLDELILESRDDRLALVRGIINYLKRSNKIERTDTFWINEVRVRPFLLTPSQLLEMNIDNASLGKVGVSEAEYENLSQMYIKYGDIYNTDISEEKRGRLIQIVDRLNKIQFRNDQLVGLSLSNEQLKNISFSQNALLRFLKSGPGKKDLLKLASNKMGYSSLDEFLYDIYLFDEKVVINGQFLQYLANHIEFELTPAQLSKIILNRDQLAHVDFSKGQKDRNSISDSELNRIRELIAKYGERGPILAKTDSKIGIDEKRMRSRLKDITLLDVQLKNLNLDSQEYVSFKITGEQVGFVLKNLEDLLKKEKLYRLYWNSLKSLKDNELEQVAIDRNFIDEANIKNEQLLKIKLSNEQKKLNQISDQEIFVFKNLLKGFNKFEKNSPSYVRYLEIEQKIRSVEYTKKQLLSISLDSDQISKMPVNVQNMLLIQDLDVKGECAQLLKSAFFDLFANKFEKVTAESMMTREQRRSLDLRTENFLKIDYSKEQLSSVGLSSGELRTFKERRRRFLLESDSVKSKTDFYDYFNIIKKLRQVKLTSKQVASSTLKLSQIKNLILNSEQINKLVLDTNVVDELILVTVTKKVNEYLQKKIGDFTLTNAQIHDLNFSEDQLFKMLIKPIQLNLVGLERKDFQRYRSFKLGSSDIINPRHEYEKVVKEIIEIEDRLKSVAINQSQINLIELSNEQINSFDLKTPQILHVLKLAYQFELEFEGGIKELERVVRTKYYKDIDPTERRSYHQQLNYKNMGKSLIQWDTLSSKTFLDLNTWRKERELKDKSPYWKNILREKNLREMGARFIDCIGECVVYRGLGESQAQSRSSIMEGDEIVNGGDSYSWIYMLDGSLVRMAPKSSITLNEINIGINKIFFNVRVNWGNVLWMSRDQHFMAENVKSETDVLFLPSSVREANVGVVEKNYEEGNLLAFLDNQKHFLDQYKKLNEKINVNNKSVSKKVSSVLFVMPNGNFYSDMPTIEFVVLNGNKSYVKLRKKGADLFVSNDPIRLKLGDFFFRGYSSKKAYPLDVGQWYEVSKNGDDISIYEGELSKKFAINEKLTSHIPTLKLAREIFFQRYSQPFFVDNISNKSLAENYGYRLWEDELYLDGKTDMDMRLDFLQEYTRRIETTNLKTVEKLRARVRARSGESILFEEYGDHFFSKAMDIYALGGHREKFGDIDHIPLNSEKNPFWKYVKGKSRRSEEYLIYRN